VLDRAPLAKDLGEGSLLRTLTELMCVNSTAFLQIKKMEDVSEGGLQRLKVVEGPKADVPLQPVAEDIMNIDKQFLVRPWPRARPCAPRADGPCVCVCVCSAWWATRRRAR
jgi:hypothetical protein